MPVSPIGARPRRREDVPMIEQRDSTAETVATDWFVDQVAAVLSDDSGDGRQPVLAERTAGGGKMPPLNTRDEAEAYRVTRGIVTFFVDGETVSAGPGDVVVAPAGGERPLPGGSDHPPGGGPPHVPPPPPLP